MKIGLDIDGVILDFERTMRCYAEVYDLLILKKNGVQKSYEFDYLKRYDWTLEERKNFINDYLVYATLNKTSLMPLVKEMLEFFEAEGYDYCFISARGLIKEETKLAVIEVFKRYGIPTDKIYFAVRDKVSMCRKLGIDLMVEDKKTNVDMISKIIPVFVFDAPYNQTCSGTNVIRVYSWYQVYQEITEKFAPVEII